MRRRGFLQGLALLVPGIAVAPAIAKSVTVEVNSRTVELDVSSRIGDDTFNGYVDVKFHELMTEAWQEVHNIEKASGSTLEYKSMAAIPLMAITVMRRKQQAAMVENRLLRLVYTKGVKRDTLPGPLGIRYLAGEIVIRDGIMDKVLKSRTRQLGTYLNTDLVYDAKAQS